MTSFIIYNFGCHQRVISNRMGGLYSDNQHAAGFLTSSEKRRRREWRRRTRRSGRREQELELRNLNPVRRKKGGGRRKSRERLRECEVFWRDFGRLIAGTISLEILPRPLQTHFDQLKKRLETLVRLFPPSLALSFPRLRVFFPHHWTSPSAFQRNNNEQKLSCKGGTETTEVRFCWIAVGVGGGVETVKVTSIHRSRGTNFNALRLRCADGAELR